MEEEITYFEPEPKCFDDNKPISVCKCLLDDDSSESIAIPLRKQKILTTVTKTEAYLRERRIPELIRFLLTKVIAEGSNKPTAFLDKLLDDCMLFRAGHGLAPVLYENRHLEAIVKSFDAGQRGWLSTGQVRRIYNTLGLNLEDSVEERIPCELVLATLRKTQEVELFNLLSAGMNIEENGQATNSESTT